MKGFSHAGHHVREPADINQLLEDVLHMAAAQLRGRATVERTYVELPPVSCVPQELKQVFLNLIVNAGQAISDGGTSGGVTMKRRTPARWSVSEADSRSFDKAMTTSSSAASTMERSASGLAVASSRTTTAGSRLPFSAGTTWATSSQASTSNCAPSSARARDARSARSRCTTKAIGRAAKAAGAKYAVGQPLRLGPAIVPQFMPVLEREFPDLVARYRLHYGNGNYVSAEYKDALMHRLHQLQHEFGFPVAESRRRREQLEGRQPRWMKEEWQATLPLST